MKAVDLVLDAIKSGISATAEDAQAAYREMADAIRHFLKDKEKKDLGEMMLSEYQQDPTDTWRKALAKVLTETAADKDERVVGAALNVLGLVKLGSTEKFRIEGRDIQSVIQADNIENLTQIIQIITQTDNGLKDVGRTAYLNRVLGETGFLSLEGIDPKAVTSESRSRLRLGAVYTALLTHGTEKGEAVHPSSRMEESRRSSALAALDRHKRLVLLGDPGSGKTTFVNFAAWCMAGELLGLPDANLKLLTAPLPDDDGKDGDEHQTWRHGALIPVRVTLRDFAAQGLPDPPQKATASHLWDFVTAELKKATLGDYAPHLQSEMLEKGGIFFLDGLDEVPEARNRRVQIKAVVEDVIKTYHKCRVLITSRTYAYQNQAWKISDLPTAALALFSQGQIHRFVDRWHAHTAEIRGLDADDARGKAVLLKRAIFSSERLQELAARPLLLTLMASLHSWRGGSLPDRREELYSDTVDLLLDWWESPKTVRDDAGEIRIIQPSLLEWLNTDRKKIRRLLNRLAYTVHDCQPELTGTADVAETDLVQGLLQLSRNPDVKPKRLIEYISERTGVMVPRGVGVYTFQHRTFQEYLAACHLTDHEFPYRIARLGREDVNRWREAVLLAGAKAAGGSEASVWQLVDALCFKSFDDPEAEMPDVWGGLLAGQLLAETANLEEVAEPNRTRLDRVRKWLLHILTGDQLPATERAGAGNALAVLGDPRLEVTTLPGMEFCYVPPGPSMMGEENQTEAFDYGYWIGRHPVTNAQFSEFVKAGGYRKARYWKEASGDGAWKSGKIKDWLDDRLRDKPHDYGLPFNLSNHPVVGVSWHEAVAFTKWLTERLRPKLGEDFIIRLPKQGEWEKAARGGEHIPIFPTVLSIGEIQTQHDFNAENLRENPRPERQYPWGDDSETDQPDSDRLNYYETGIGATASAGCFSNGFSPYGCHDMSGNVWEWCMDRVGSNRVIRGGAWNYPAVSCRTANRNYLDPAGRYDSGGFRLVFLPGQQGEPSQ